MLFICLQAAFKQAYLLARHDAAFRAVASRFRTIVFLATPHRGSDGAQVLNSILKVSFSHAPRQYIDELQRNSGTLQYINEEFCQVAEELELYSFYETIKTTFGLGGIGNNVMIVDKSSATLDYKNEQRFPIQANHRGICKFDESNDSNYRILRDVLAKIAQTGEKNSQFSFWSIFYTW